MGSRDGGRAGKCSIAFFIEAGGNSFDGVGEEVVVVGDGEGEAGFDGGKLGDHFMRFELVRDEKKGWESGPKVGLQHERLNAEG